MKFKKKRDPLSISEINLIKAGLPFMFKLFLVCCVLFQASSTILYSSSQNFYYLEEISRRLLKDEKTLKKISAKFLGMNNFEDNQPNNSKSQIGLKKKEENISTYKNPKEIVCEHRKKEKRRRNILLSMAMKKSSIKKNDIPGANQKRAPLKKAHRNRNRKQKILKRISLPSDPARKGGERVQRNQGYPDSNFKENRYPTCFAGTMVVLREDLPHQTYDLKIKSTLSDSKFPSIVSAKGFALEKVDIPTD